MNPTVRPPGGTESAEGGHCYHSRKAGDGIVHLMVGIPALNEGPTIADVVRAVPATIRDIDAVDILVVDDGSTDDTAEKAAEAGARVVRHGWNRGLGVAFQTLVREALENCVDILVTIDGDGQLDPNDIPTLIAPIMAHHAEVCTASRFTDPAIVPDMPRVKKWGNHRVAGLVSMLTGRRHHDVSCGFRAYSREALLRLTIHQTFTYTHETFLDLAAKYVPIHEVPLAVKGTRQFGASKVASNVLGYGWRTGLIMLQFYRDHRPLRLCTYLALPLAAAGLGLFVLSLLNVLETGYWLKWAALSAASLFATALSVTFLGFMADIACAMRMNQEEILYWLRRVATDDRWELLEDLAASDRQGTLHNGNHETDSGEGTTPGDCESL